MAMLSACSFRFLLLSLSILSLPWLTNKLYYPYARSTFWNDPTSAFFNATRAYSHRYSAYRYSQAEAFLDTVHDVEFKRNATTTPPWLCVGMPSIRRPEGLYFRGAMGSLLSQLRLEERNQIHLLPMIAHIDPNQHPVYNEPWLHNVADSILLYNHDDQDYEHIAELEAERARTGVPDREKHMWDYSYLMRQCKETGAEYVLLLEDDVLALDGWFHRIKAALKDVEARTRAYGDRTFYYLRLFYTERDWPLDAIEAEPRLKSQTQSYMYRLIAISFLIGFIAVRQTRQAILLKLILILSLATALYWMPPYIHTWQYKSGRFTALPFKNVTEHGAMEMSAGGCCAQGIIYPIATIDPLTAFYRQRRIGFIDELADQLAWDHPEKTGRRWAMVPSVLQHVGGKSSKGDNWGSDKPGEMSAAERIWNFAFEASNPRKLAKEHEHAYRRMLDEGEI